MPKYILKDSTGQIWNDIDDNNISEFMEQYPEAEIIETIDDVIEVEDDIENLKQEPEDDSIDSPENIKQVVSDYDTSAMALKEAFRDVSIDIEQEHYDVVRLRQNKPHKTLFKSKIEVVSPLTSTLSLNHLNCLEPIPNSESVF